jgi:uncharacterized membrane protein
MKMSEVQDPYSEMADHLAKAREKAVDAHNLTQERKKTHGDWKEQSYVANNLMAVMGQSKNWEEVIDASQRIALMMIATKISRILTGDPNEPDHWNDIAGYAHLGLTGHTEV